MRTSNSTRPTRESVTDDPDHVRHARAALLGPRRGGHGRLSGGGDVGDRVVENRDDELVLIGEALVEIACGQTRLPADGAHGQLCLGIVGAE